MIRHGIDLNEGLFFVFDDAHDVAMEFSFVLFRDEGLSAFDGEDDMYVDLCVCVWHGFLFVKIIQFYTDAAPTGLDFSDGRVLHRCRPYGA